MNLALFVRPQPRTWLNHFFFFIKLDGYFVRNVMKPNFFKKRPIWLGRPKKFQKWSKNVLEFSQKSNLFICTFFTRI